MTKALLIEVKVSDDRRYDGTLTLKNADTGAVLFGPVPVHAEAARDAAKAKGNEERDPLKPWGNTPTGQYKVGRIKATGPGTGYNDHSYGSEGAIELDPTGDDAPLAKLHGRTGLLIHSGELGAGGKLRKTNGCLRLSPDNMRKLIEAMVKFADDPDLGRCEIVAAQIAVSEGDPDDDYDEGDPPPDLPGSIIFPKP